MPLFSWRPRILGGGRKTPDPSQAVQITIAPEPPEIPDSPVVQQPQKPRNVRFEEHSQQTNYQKVQPEWTNNFGCEARVIGTVRPEKNLTSSSGRIPPPEEPTTNDWRYADDVKVRVAPIDIDRSPQRFAQPTRASSVLQNLRDQKEHLEYDERRREVSTLPSYGSSAIQSSFQNLNSNQNQNQVQHQNIPNQYQNNRSEIYGTIQRSFDAQSRTDSHIPALDDMNVVFLQANDEVKRTLLPRSIVSMHQVKMSFVRTFPNVTRAFVEQPHVKIYIQEPTKGALFYELEDPNDIKNKSVLRLREKTRVTSPVPLGYLGEPDYHSETEQDDGRRLIPLNRPASAMAAPSLDFLQQKQQQLYGAHAPPKAYDIYSDPYNSDTSSHDSRSVTRSGSATPVIDRESRVRMETMERQLAGLSNLVHTALVSKGMSETTQRDMAELRREILSMHPEHAARESSEEPGSSSLSESSISSHTAYQLSALRNALKDTQRELRQLKNSAQVNAQTGNTLLREAGDKIGKILNDRMKAPSGIHVAHVQPQLQKIDNHEKEKEDVHRNEHASRLAELLHTLASFETNVETVRGSVLSNQKKLRMSEVEEMTEKLTNIGRVAADLKTEFPPIQQQIEEQIKKDMERVVREEKFIRDQNTAVDQSLRRCKALANIMVTMKKLAMVQDPTIQRRKKESSTSSPRLPPKPSGTTVGQSLQTLPHTQQHVQSQSASLQNIQQSLQSQLTPSVPPPPPPPPPAVFYAPATNVVKVAPMVEQPKSPISVLDNVLEEVGEPQGPPRPPSRYSVPDVRQKYQRPPELPDGLRNLIEDVARRASPGPEQIVDRRQDLEERQERLAEKQRQLRSQFQQLQQLAPMP